MRHLTRFRAFAAGLFGFGYVYVGRLSVEIALTLGLVGLFAAISWTGWIFDPAVLYIWVGLWVASVLLQVVHPVWIAGREKQAPRKLYNRWWFYALWAVVLTPVLTGWLEANREPIFGVDSVTVSHEPMTPTLQPGDRLTVDAWRYRDEEPAVGDLAVLEVGDWRWVRRVVGLPGDVIEMREGVLYRNGAPVVEPYLDAYAEGPELGLTHPPIQLGEGEYWVLGDSRRRSRDSRWTGPIRREQLRGRVESIWASSTKKGFAWDRFPKSFAPDYRAAAGEGGGG